MKVTQCLFFIFVSLGLTFVGFYIIVNTNHEKKKDNIDNYIRHSNTKNLNTHLNLNTNLDTGKNKSLHDLAWLWMDSVYGPVIVRSVAYFDDRASVTKQPCLRLYFIFVKDLDATFWNSLRISVKLSGEEDIVEISNIYFSEVYVRPWKVNGSSFSQDLITISHSRFLSTHPISVFINYLKVSGESNGTVTIPVVLPDESNPVEFAVCVKPLYGKLKPIDVEFLVEWFEIYIDLGISEFHIYNSSLQYSKQLHTILSNYGVSLINVGDDRFIKELVCNSTEVYKFAIFISRASYIDCIYRNYKRVKYMLFVDTAEIIMPQVDLSYTDLFKRLFSISNNYSDAASISTQMCIFYRLGQEKYDTPQTTMYQKFVNIAGNDTRIIGFNIAMKSFINTQNCIMIFHHYCIKAAPGHQIKIKVPPELALTHHYRNELKSKLKKFNTTQNTILTNVTVRYYLYLETKIRKVKTIFTEQ